MTDNPTALSAEELADWQRLYETNPIVRRVNDMHVATITAKDAEIAAQAETIDQQNEEIRHIHSDALFTRQMLADAEAEVATLKAEVAALRRENEQLRVDLKLADAAQHLPAALSSKEAGRGE